MPSRHQSTSCRHAKAEEGTRIKEQLEQSQAEQRRKGNSLAVLEANFESQRAALEKAQEVRGLGSILNPMKPTELGVSM